MNELVDNIRAERPRAGRHFPHRGVRLVVKFCALCLSCGLVYLTLTRLQDHLTRNLYPVSAPPERSLTMSFTKNPTAVKIGNRIKQARKMAGLETQAKLLERIPDWSPSRLGNYESGISMPSPDDVMRLAQAVEASPCWILFGIGPIRANHRDVQAIRHQNLDYIVTQAKRERGGLPALLKALGLARKRLDELLSNPFTAIPDRIARRAESYLKKTPGWLDEQHVESDPLCLTFPADIRELMTIFSELNAFDRARLLAIGRVFAESKAKELSQREREKLCAGVPLR